VPNNKGMAKQACLVTGSTEVEGITGKYFHDKRRSARRSDPLLRPRACDPAGDR
jgi:hypothetical protein